MAHRHVFRHSPEYSYKIPQARTCYLDTSVVRRRLKTLKNSPLADISYTSALTFVELLACSRRSDKSFRISLAAVECIFAADIAIDWRFPEVQILSAFPAFRPEADIYEERTASLLAIVQVMRASSSPNDFSKRLAKLNVSPGLEYFETYDNDFGKNFVLTANNARKKSLETFDPQSFSAKALGLPSNVSHDEYTRALRNSKLNLFIFLLAITDSICDSKGITDKKAKRATHASYDGSIDPFLKGFGWWQLDHSLGRTPGRNDFLDLAHLLYLYPNAHLVTCDKELASCATAIGVSVIGPNGIATSGAAPNTAKNDAGDVCV